MLRMKKYAFGKVLQKKIDWKKFSIQVKKDLEGNCANLNLLNKISLNFLIPSLTQDRLKVINEITGITIKKGHLSWSKISSQTLTIIDWNFKSLPEGFKNMDEASILKLANTLKQVIPVSDLYVMEKIGPREGSVNLNDVRLSSMLMVLLNEFRNDVQTFDKVIFQKENVMNILHNLLIGSERVSTRQVFEKLLNNDDKVNECDENNTSKNDSAVTSLLTKINSENLQCYDKSLPSQQECLSFVLLLTLSFIDVFIYQTVESLRKIEMQIKFKKVK